MGVFQKKKKKTRLKLKITFYKTIGGFKGICQFFIFDDPLTIFSMAFK